MKLRIALMAAATAIALTGTGMAASLSDVVQKGAMADRIKEKNQINLATAKALGDHCVAEAASKNMGVSVVIVDQFGIITYYVRADGQGKANTETALMKAKTVLNTRAPSKAQMNAVRSGNTSEARVISVRQLRQRRRTADRRRRSVPRRHRRRRNGAHPGHVERRDLRSQRSDGRTRPAAGAAP